MQLGLVVVNYFDNRGCELGLVREVASDQWQAAARRGSGDCANPGGKVLFTAKAGYLPNRSANCTSPKSEIFQALGFDPGSGRARDEGNETLWPTVNNATALPVEGLRIGLNHVNFLNFHLWWPAPVAPPNRQDLRRSRDAPCRILGHQLRLRNRPRAG